MIFYSFTSQVWGVLTWAYMSKWVTFSPDILGHGIHFGEKKNIRRVGPFHKKCIKLVAKPLEMGPKLQKF